MKKLTLATLLAVGLATGANAAGDAAADRQNLMKDVGAAIGMGSKIAKGEVEFNAIAANLVLRTMHSAALGFGYMFPEGSETGADTEASPAIWSDRAGFDAAVAKFATDSAGGVEDLDGFRAKFGQIASNCGACHKAYRVKKN